LAAALAAAMTALPAGTATATTGAPRPAAAAWSQQSELANPGPSAAGDVFGRVAISGSSAVVGAPAKNSHTGAAYVFVRSGKRWSVQAELTASGVAPFDEFGASVAISGNTAVVGAPGTRSRAGAAYVFVRSGKAWSERADLTFSGGAAGGDFGSAVGISGTTVVVGAPFANSLKGAAYVFVRSGKGWSRQAELIASGTAPRANFGWAVAISGRTVLVGAPYENSLTGAAYVFARSGRSWSQQARLTAPDAARPDAFGSSVAISGRTALVGAPGKNANTGAAYVFAGARKAWSQQAELTAADAAERDRFGLAVAISGQTSLVGAFARNDLTGAAYVFARAGKGWFQQAELTASDAAQGDRFGSSVAISGKTALAGAPNENSLTGAVYAFVRSAGRGSGSGGWRRTAAVRPAVHAALPAVSASSGTARNGGSHRKLFLYVPNLDANTITSYPLTTKGGNVRPAATISDRSGSLNRPANLVFDSHGNLWVGNEMSDTIVEFTSAQLAASGSPVPRVTISANNGSLDSPEPTAFDSAGNLWVANARSDTIVEFTPGQLARSGSPVPRVTISANNGSLLNPFVLKFSRSGDLWVTNRRANIMVEFTPGQLARSGSPVPRVTISASNASLYYPYTPDFDSAGNLWVTNQFGNTIAEYTPAQLATSGSPIPNITIGANSGSLTGPVGSVFDPSGNLWVANYRINSIVRYAPAQLAANGNPQPVVTISGARTGLDYPVGTAIGP